MKYIQEFELFELFGGSKGKRRAIPTTAGTLPKIEEQDPAALSRATDALNMAGYSNTDNPKLQRKAGNSIKSFWGSAKKVGGTIFNNPEQIGSSLEKSIDSPPQGGYTITYASGRTETITPYSGLGSLVSGAISLISGVLGKIIEGPKVPLDGENIKIDPIHDRLSKNTISELENIANPGDFAKWSSDYYKKAGVNRGDNPDMDLAMDSAWMRWLGTSKGKNAIRIAKNAKRSGNLGSASSELGLAEGAAESEGLVATLAETGESLGALLVL